MRSNEKIRARISELDRGESNIAKERRERQNECTHTINGSTDIIKIVDIGGKSKLKCPICGKIIEGTPPTADEFKKACQVIETGIDYIKIQQHESPEKENRLIDDVRSLMSLIYTYNKVYDNLRVQLGKKNKKNDQRSRTAFTISGRSSLN